MHDPIVEEIRATRHELAERFDNDLSRIIADVRRQEEESGREYISLPPRPPKPRPWKRWWKRVNQSPE